MDMISSDSSVAASAHDHNHQEQHQHQKEAMGAAVASPQTEEGRNGNGKQARQQQVAAAGSGGGGGGERKPRPAHDHALKCPRCDSTNTKFCYYNYSMSQPRYFCKACRRYWTQGGSLRNVPVGGGCRKKKRSSGSSSSASASSGSSSSSSKISSTLVPGQPMVPPSTTDFPNVLPTLMSTGFELSRDHRLSLPLAPLPLSSPPPALAPGVGTTTPFMDILTGGFLDGTSSIHQISNGFYGATTVGGNEMVMPMPMPMPPSFGFGVMQHQHGMGGHAAAFGGGATAATQGGQWPTTAQHGNYNGDVAAGSAGLQVGDGAHQQGSSNNNVMMDSNNNSGSSTREYCYWNKNSSGSAAAANNPWQAGGLINSGSLI